MKLARYNELAAQLGAPLQLREETPMQALEPARCAWEVTAGTVLGRVDPQYTRRWVLTDAEFAEGHFHERSAEVEAYVRQLQWRCAQGDGVGWVEQALVRV